MQITSVGLLLTLLLAPLGAVATAAGNPVSIDSAQLETLQTRAEAGSDKAQMKLASMYLDGRGVSADPDRAVYFYRLAAERDIAFAQHRLARLYLDGERIAADPARGLEWMQRAARLGFVQAQLDLSRLYEEGSDVAQDFIASHKWLSIAASLKDENFEPRRKALEEKMSFTQLARARLLSRVCILTGYLDC